MDWTSFRPWKASDDSVFHQVYHPVDIAQYSKMGSLDAYYLEEKAVLTFHSVVVNRGGSDSYPSEGLKEDWSFHNRLEVVRKDG